MRTFKSSIRHEVAKHFAKFFLEAESNFEHVNLDSFRFSDSCCSRSCTQQHRTQTTCNIELLADASSIGTRWSSESFSQKQKRLLETGELFPRGTAEEPQMPRPKPPTVIQRRT